MDHSTVHFASASERVHARRFSCLFLYQRSREWHVTGYCDRGARPN